jgi:hypothetical protein
MIHRSSNIDLTRSLRSQRDAINDFEDMMKRFFPSELFPSSDPPTQCAPIHLFLATLFGGVFPFKVHVACQVRINLHKASTGNLMQLHWMIYLKISAQKRNQSKLAFNYSYR